PRWTGRRDRIKRQLAGPVRIARHSQILVKTEIGAELERVIPKRVCNITDPLILVLLLIKRAVALVDPKRVSKRKGSCAIQNEGGHAGSIIVIQVQARNACIPRRRGAQPVRVHKYPIPEEPKTEIGEPVRTNHVIGSSSQTL